MRRRHLFLLPLVATVTAAVILVQRDSFVRRWLLRPTSVEPAKKTLSRVRTNGLVTVDQAVAMIGREAGVAIDLDYEALVRPHIREMLPHSHYVRDYPPIVSLKIEIDLDDASVEQALDPVLHLLRDGDGVVTPRGDRLLVTTRENTKPDPTLVVRAYDLRPLLAYHSQSASEDEALVKQRVPAFGTASDASEFCDVVYFMCAVSPTRVIDPMGTTMLMVATRSQQEKVADFMRAIAAPRPPGHVPPPSAIGPAERRLREPLPSLDLRRTDLKEAIRRIGQAARVNIQVDWRYLGSSEIEADTPIDLDVSGMTGNEAIAAISHAVSTPGRQLGYFAGSGCVVVGIRGLSRFTEDCFETYDVADLLIREVRRLRSLSSEERSGLAMQLGWEPAASTQWDLVTLAQAALRAAISRLPGLLREPYDFIYRGRLIVHEEPYMQEAVARRLEDLRASTGPLYAGKPTSGAVSPKK
jgi:hypothetical protein